MSHYIITGASGHIGNNLVRLINAKEPDSKITALVRRQIKEELENTNCKQIICDISDKDFLSKTIKKTDIVIHLAGVIDLTNTKREECHQINFGATKTICDVCKEKGARFIYTGSVDGIYRSDKNAEINEPEDYFPEKVMGNYGQTKAMAMKYVLSQMKNNPNFNCAMVLPTAVIGINDYKPSAVGRIIKSTIDGGKQVGMKGGYNFVDVQDVCSAIYTLCHNDKKDQYIISGQNMTVKELFEFINDYKNLKQKPTIIPTWFAKLMLPFIKSLNKITIKSLTEPHNYSCKKAKDELGLVSTPIENTLKNSINWFEKQKKKNA